MPDKNDIFILDLLGSDRFHAQLSSVLTRILGLIFLITALLKASDMMLFTRQLGGYNIVPQALTGVVAWAVITIEWVLGFSLAALYRPKTMLSALALLLFVFFLITGNAWLNHSDIDCGCFGAWFKRTPGEAMVEDLLLLALTIVLWFGIKKHPPGKKPFKKWAVCFAGILGLLLPFMFGVSIADVSFKGDESSKLGLESADIAGIETTDLSRGTYLIVLMDTGCSHCLEVTEDFSMLAMDKDIPTIIALSMNDKEERDTFKREYDPLFPIAQIDENRFWTLLGDDKLPKIMLVENRNILKTWSKEIPGIQELKKTH